MGDTSVPIKWRLYGYLNGFWIGGKTMYATNQHLAEHLKCSERQVSRCLEDLEKDGLLTRDIQGFKRLILPGGMTPGVRGGRHRVSGEGDVGRQHISDSIADNISSEPEVRVESYIPGKEDQEARPKRETRTKDKEAIYKLFSSRQQPWWRHKQQKEAALSLFDLVGYEKVRAGVEFMKENADDKFCPQAATPFEYEQKLPSLANYRRRHER